MKHCITLILLLSTIHITPSEHSQLSPVGRLNESDEIATIIGSMIGEDDYNPYAMLPTVRTFQERDGTISYCAADVTHLNLCQALDQALQKLYAEEQSMNVLWHRYSDLYRETAKNNNLARMRHASNMIQAAREQSILLANNLYFLQSPYILSRIRTIILALRNTINATKEIKWNTMKHKIDNDEALDAPLAAVEHGVMGGRKTRKNNLVNDFIYYNTLIGENELVINDQPLQILDIFITFFKFYKYTIARNVIRPYFAATENAEALMNDSETEESGDSSE